MTEKFPKRALESSQPAPPMEAPAAKPRPDLIDQSLRALFDGAEHEPLPDRISELLKRMASESPK